VGVNLPPQVKDVYYVSLLDQSGTIRERKNWVAFGWRMTYDFLHIFGWKLLHVFGAKAFYLIAYILQL